MPFLASVSARQGGLVLANASKIDTPTFGASSGTSGGYTFAISNYSALNTYSFSVTNSGSATQSSGTVTVTGIGNAVTATCTATVSRNGFLSNSASTTGTSFSQLATPTFSATTATSGGFTFTISNYDAANGYTISTSSGSVSRSGSTITQTGLGNSASATISVTATRASFVNSATSTVSGTAQSILATPTLSAAAATVGGFTFTITNYDAANGYTLSSTSGAPSRSGPMVTVSGLGSGGSAIASVTATRSGFVNSVAGIVSGTAVTVLATPTFSGYAAGATPGRYKYRITIANYDAANTYTVSVSAGSFTRSGSLITANGSSDNQSITVFATASRSGFGTSAQGSSTNSTPGAPTPGGTFIAGPQYYPTIGNVPNGCGYNMVHDGNYGQTLSFVSGPCNISSGGDYCVGCVE